jgi:hypothetical protein
LDQMRERIAQTVEDIFLAAVGISQRRLSSEVIGGFISDTGGTCSLAINTPRLALVERLNSQSASELCPSGDPVTSGFACVFEPTYLPPEYLSASPF